MNHQFRLKLITDELSETLFFSMGYVIDRARAAGVTTLRSNGMTVVIKETNDIVVNGVKFKNSALAREYIQLVTN